MEVDWISLPREIWLLILEFAGYDDMQMYNTQVPRASFLHLTCKSFSWLSDFHHSFLEEHEYGFWFVTLDIFGRNRSWYDLTFRNNIPILWGFRIYENNELIYPSAYIDMPCSNVCLLVINEKSYDIPKCNGILVGRNKSDCDCDWCSQMIEVEKHLKEMDSISFSSKIRYSGLIIRNPPLINPGVLTFSPKNLQEEPGFL